MQVNSAQDWLTAKKRQVIASTFHSIPAPQSRRTNASFVSAMANRATQVQLLVVPEVSGWRSVRGGETTSNWCCLSNGNTRAAPGTLTPTNNTGIVRFNVIAPISVTATRPVVS